MSSKNVQFAKFCLKLQSESLKLEIASIVDVKFPYASPSLDNDRIVKAFTSGNVWASRARRCRVDFEVFLNDERLDQASRIAILEPLGCHIRDAHFWSQLSLSASLVVPQTDQSADPSTDISVYINHSIHSQETQSKARLLDHDHIRPPDKVLCAEFERLHVHLSFYRIQQSDRQASKRKSLPEDCVDLMLPDHTPALEDEAKLITFENVVTILHASLSTSILKCFDEVNIHRVDNLPKRLNQLSSSSDDKIRNSEISQESRPSRFSDAVTSKLRAWLDANPGRTSPTNADRVDLMKQTGLARRQLSSWFSYQKRKKSMTTPVSTTNANKHLSNLSQIPEIYDGDDEDMLLFQFKDKISVDEIEHNHSADEMIFPQIASLQTSLPNSQVSTLSTASTTMSLKRLAPDGAFESNLNPISATFPVMLINKLTALALRVMVAGPSNRRGYIQGAQIDVPPLISLSALIPSIFCPGFKQLITHNSRFIPTISNAICSSWVRNAQGVVLRQKLMTLSNCKISEYHDGEGEEGSAERLVSVVQARLWRMMQRSLYDSDAVKVLWKEGKSQGAEDIGKTEEECDDEDLLGGNAGNANVAMKTDHLGDFMSDDEESFFEDLLGAGPSESDDGLLDYLEEQERLAVEAETEEMLFGSHWDGHKIGEIFEIVHDTEESLPLGYEAYTDEMLL